MTCPTCGAATCELDPIGGVGGPAVVECEAGHQSGVPVDVSGLVTAVDIGGGPRAVTAATFTPVLPEPPPGVTPGMLAKLGGFDRSGSIQVPADWWRGGETLTGDDYPVFTREMVERAIDDDL